MISGTQFIFKEQPKLGNLTSTFIGFIKPIVLFLVCYAPFAVIGQQTNNENKKDSILVSSAKAIYTGNFYGQVWDGETRDPMAFASLRWGSTGKGGITNFEGEFHLGKGPFPSDTFWIDYIGFETYYILLDTVKSMPLQIHLTRKIERSDAVVITLGINPAMKWLKLAQDNRKKNSPANIQSYQCETFSKATVAINNISKTLQKTKIAKNMGSYFDTISYMTGDSNKSILPVLISEVLSDFSYQKTPYLTKEVVKATRIRGLGVTDGSLVGQLMGNTFTNYSIYDESLVVFDKGIPSPIADAAELLYDYRLVQVDYTHTPKVVQLKVTPKNPRDLAFSGFIWIQDSTGAIVRLALEITGASNLNYVEKLKFAQEYERVESGEFLCTKVRVLMDIGELSKQAAGMIASNTTTVKNIKVGVDFPPRFFDNRIVMTPGANLYTDTFWLNHAHTKQSEEEKRVASKIDTLNAIPTVKTYVDLVNFLVDGYQRYGILDYGPYYTLASWNLLEGARLKMGFRTTPAISKNSVTTGFFAYGFTDKKWKYGFNTDIYFNVKNWSKLTLMHRRDVELIGITDNDLYGQSLFTAFNLFGSKFLNFTTQSRLTYGIDLRPGMRVSGSLYHAHYDFPKVSDFKFAWYENLSDINSISTEMTNASASFTFVYEPRSYSIKSDLSLMTFSAPGPRYQLLYQKGIKGLVGSQFEYDKVVLSYSYTKVWSMLGRTIYSADLAKVWGTLPYPLLSVYVGNQSFMYNQKAYNQMRNFEFISDQSVQLGFEHHFNGYIFNRVPLLNKFKLREIVTSKAIYGTLNQANRDIIPTRYQVPDISEFKSFSYKVPYWELGVGLENIFKCIRVDFIWRMTYRAPGDPRNFGIKASYSLSF